MTILAKTIRGNPHEKSARQQARIRKLFCRVLQTDEVDFLIAVWKAGSIKAADCPKFAVGLFQRGWIEHHGRTVRLSDEVLLLLAESAE